MPPPSATDEEKTAYMHQELLHAQATHKPAKVAHPEKWSFAPGLDENGKPFSDKNIAEVRSIADPDSEEKG